MKFQTHCVYLRWSPVELLYDLVTQVHMEGWLVWVLRVVLTCIEGLRQVGQYLKGSAGASCTGVCGLVQLYMCTCNQFKKKVCYFLYQSLYFNKQMTNVWQISVWFTVSSICFFANSLCASELCLRLLYPCKKFWK